MGCPDGQTFDLLEELALETIVGDSAVQVRKIGAKKYYPYI
jgi:hypothetical protein